MKAKEFLDQQVQAPFSQIPLDLLVAPGITPAAIVVYGYLDFLSGKRGWWRGPISEVLEAMGQRYGDTAFRAACKLLVVGGWITTKRLGKEHDFVLLFTITPQTRSIPDVATAVPPIDRGGSVTFQADPPRLKSDGGSVGKVTEGPLEKRRTLRLKSDDTVHSYPHSNPDSYPHSILFAPQCDLAEDTAPAVQKKDDKSTKTKDEESEMHEPRLTGEQYDAIAVNDDESHDPDDQAITDDESYGEREQSTRERNDHLSASETAIWTALAIEFGHSPKTEREHRQWLLSVRELASGGYSGAEVHLACRKYRETLPNALMTPFAITKHISTLIDTRSGYQQLQASVAATRGTTTPTIGAPPKALALTAEEKARAEQMHAALSARRAQKHNATINA